MKSTNWHLFFGVLRKVGLVLFGISFVLNGIEQSLTDLVQAELGVPTGAGQVIWIYGGLNILASLLVPLLQSSLIFRALFSLLGPTWTGERRHLYSELVKEQLRAYGQIFWGLICFVVPGVLLFFRYLLVPFVVGFDHDYTHGKKDALVASREIWKKHRFQILAYVVFFLVIIPLVFSMGEEWNKPFRLPLLSLPFQLAETLIIICSHLILFQMWRKAHVES